jgi:hypothetical protein
MKKQMIGVLAAAVLVLGLFFRSVYSQEDMTVVDNSGFDNPQRTASHFNHDEHNEAAGIEQCNECHHVYEDGKKLEDESSEDQTCSECHQEKDSGGQPGLAKAFHLNCKGCHMREQKGPVMCGECHQK